MRGVMYARQIDGIRLLGAGGRGGLGIDFGANGKIALLEFDWRNLASYRSYNSPDSNAIVSSVINGKARISVENPEIPTDVKKLTITKITPYYMSATSGAPEDFIFPFLNVEVSATISETNITTFYLDCPAFSEK